MPFCCPDNSWPPLELDTDYKNKGVVEKVGEGDICMDLYRVGQGEKCIVWNYHIFGFNGGRLKQLADQLADKGGREKYLLF